MILSKIVHWLVKIGTKNTTNGNYIFLLKEIEEKFGKLNITKIKTLVDMLHKRKEITDEGVWIHDGCLDLNFWLNYCPNVEGDN